MRWYRAASCGTRPPSCSVTWPAGNRRRLPTDPVVLRGCLPLSLRATRKPDQVEPRADRGPPRRPGSSRAALSLDPCRRHERQGLDVAVIEVGLGGRLDATNVITPLVSVVTKIAREHTDYLGTDLASIAREKAGIAKRNVPFITGEMDPAVRQVLIAEAERRGAT